MGENPAFLSASCSFQGKKRGLAGRKGFLCHGALEESQGSQLRTAGPGCGRARGKTEEEARKGPRRPGPVLRAWPASPPPAPPGLHTQINTHRSSCLPQVLLSGSARHRRTEKMLKMNKCCKNWREETAGKTKTKTSISKKRLKKNKQCIYETGILHH